MAKYDAEFKFKVVSAYLNGDGSYLVLARKFNIPSKSNIVKWVGIYKNYGKDGLVRKRFHKNYTVQFKIDVINYRLRTEKSFPEIALIFNISEPSLVHSWLKTWEAEGIKGLTRAKGRPSMSNKANKKTIANKMTKEKQLEKEIELLRAENAYLKKLRASGINIPNRLLKQNQESSTNSGKISD